jgi:Uma2 family endonuclease
MGTLEQWPIRRLTVDETLRMVDAGILDEDEHVELLEGVLVEMSPQGPSHAERTAMLADRLRSAYSGRARVREEKPLVVGRYSLPEPDIAVVLGAPGAYESRHPDGNDTLLVVELALTSRAMDRRKAAIYAAAGIQVYWIVDLANRKLELRSAPEDGAYVVTRVLREDETVTLPGLDVEWRVGDLLP